MRPEAVGALAQRRISELRGPIAIVAVFRTPGPETLRGEMQAALGREPDRAMDLMRNRGDAHGAAARSFAAAIQFRLAMIRCAAGSDRRECTAAASFANVASER